MPKPTANIREEVKVWCLTAHTHTPPRERQPHHSILYTVSPATRATTARPAAVVARVVAGSDAACATHQHRRGGWHGMGAMNAAASQAMLASSPPITLGVATRSAVYGSEAGDGAG